MLNISDSAKEHFLTDSNTKNLVFTTNPNWLYPEDVQYQQDMDTLNLFTGNAYKNNTYWTWNYSNNYFTDSDWFHFRINTYSNNDSYDALGFVETFAFKYRKYCNVSAQIGINSASYPSQLYFCVTYLDATGTKREVKTTFDVADYIIASGVADTVSINIDTQRISATGVSEIERIWISSIDGNADLIGTITVSKVMINVSDDKDAMPITYIENDYSDIDLNEYRPFVRFDNDNIVFDKFSLTESLCSKDNIKFGLCEASNIEIDTVGLSNDLKDERLYSFLSVKSDNPSDVPYNSLRTVNWIDFTHNGISPDTGYARAWTDSNLGNRIYTSYETYTWSNYASYVQTGNYLYIRYKVKLSDLVGSIETPSYVKPSVMYQRSDNTNWYNTHGDFLSVQDMSDDYTTITFRLTNTNTHGYIINISRLAFTFYDANKDAYSNDGTYTLSFTASFKYFQIGILSEYNETIPSFDLSNCYVYNNTINTYLEDHRYVFVPLGAHTVKDIKKKVTHNLTIKTLIMYDDMILLEQNAANWYTQYMYGIDTNEATDYGFEFARQIYSSYFNYMKNIGIENIDNYELTEVFSKTYAECASSMSTKTYDYVDLYNEGNNTPFTTGTLHYSKTEVNSPDVDKLYVAKQTNYQYKTDAEMVPYIKYFNYHDAYGRSLTKANILVEETLSDGGSNKFLVDTDDLFAISQDCTKLTIYNPTYAIVDYPLVPKTEQYTIINDFSLYSTDKTFNLANDNKRLLYYDYNKHEPILVLFDEDNRTYYDANVNHTIFECDSSITGREVVHSLLELTGCFFRMSRIAGKPEFIYCIKSGLYPSETLYPADDLYPRVGTNELLSMGKYLSVEYADYEVTKFGKIQILVDRTSNESDSNVQWQYVGDADVGLNTYIIDDNIFYCNKDMVYDTVHMTELNDTLATMFINISNMNYTPNDTEALGMPWVECGDRIGLLTYDGGFESFIYRRKLKGIQALFDTYESKGDEYNYAVKNYGY